MMFDAVYLAQDPVVNPKPHRGDASSSCTRRMTSDKTLICKFWLKSRCQRGDCKYAHGEEEKRLACKALLCQFHASGYCRLGQDCLYRHTEEEAAGDPNCSGDEKELGSGCEGKSAASTTASEADTPSLGPAAPPLDYSNYKRDWQLGRYDKTQPCMFWQEGRCQRGQGCRYAHGDEELRQACGAILCKHLQRRGRCHLGDACWFSHTEHLSDGEPAASRSGPCSNSAPSGSSQDPESPRRSGRDKTLICKFWLKNRCDRSNCKYAHGEEEKRRACKAIMCLFEASGGCRLGAECLYAHSWERLPREVEEKSRGEESGDESEVDDRGDVTMAVQSTSGTAWHKAAESMPIEAQRSACRRANSRQRLETGGRQLEADPLKSAEIPSPPALWDPRIGGLGRMKTSRQSWADLNSDSEDEDSP
mmetsp:Transcript_58959/g.121897  ORF Transcript_58959/g.121897 Transcript_58959/m.121897 type:complete len:420 (+) Transcript_58959:13-1272(+)